jgi:Carboxypeptidase regulatory-like domain/TonB-dependent Receptor Plug Domain
MQGCLCAQGIVKWRLARWCDIRGTVIVIVLALIGLGHASGQSLYGSIVGTVTDTSGAVVPAATVTVIQTQTNETRSSVTNSSGDYVVSTVPAGTYTVSISKAGFQVLETKNIGVTINTTVRVDGQLTIGAQTQTVTVTSSTAVLQTDRADVHGVVSSDDLQQLPQPTRTYEGLVGLLPGVAPPTPGFAGGGGTNNPARSMIVNVNGTSASGTNVSIDGVSATNAWVQFYSTAVPSTEAVETVNVVTASSGADQGVVNGGSIRVQIKSGTNSFHGSAYGYFENSALKSRPYFFPADTRKPKYIDNDLGGTFGGPIIKDKLFFFASYEGDFLREAAGNFYTLPTPDMVSGILASPTPIFDPATGNPDGSGRTPFPQDAAGNYILPTSRFNSVSAMLLPNIPSGVPNGVFTNNVYINTPYSYNLQKVDSKIDWNATSKLKIAGRYSDYPYKQLQPPAFGTVLGPGSGYNTNQFGNIYAFSAMATYVASPKLVIDALFGLTHTTQNLYAPLPNTRYGSDVLGIPNTNLGPLPTAGGVPQFNFTTGALQGWGYGYPSLIYQDPVFQYNGNVSWIKGNHNFRFGIDVSQQHMNHKEVGPTQFNFTGGVTGLYCPDTTGPGCANGSPDLSQFNSFADFLLGLPQNSQNNELTANWVTLRTWQFAPYVSDTWQATPKLTIYAGTGWDYFPVPHREEHGIEYYNPGTNVYEICGEGPISKNCGISVQKVLFAPRFGLAYRVQPNTVFRLGYSLAPEQINMYRDGLYNYPLTVPQSLQGTNSYSASTTLNQGFPAVPVPDISSGVVPLPPTITIDSSPKDFVRGYTESYNVTVQQELGWNVLAQIGYVGTLTIHQHTRYNINYGLPGGGQASQPLNQNFGITAQEIVILPLEHMNYQSLQAQIQKRFSNGLQFFGSYTWSKWMGLCCDPQGDGQPEIPIPQYYGLNYGVMPGDRTNNFQFSTVYQLPFGKNQAHLTHGVGAAIAGGWQINALLQFYSGSPFGVSAPGASLNAPGSPQQADQIKPNVKIYGPHGLNSPYFDITAFAPVTTARFGTARFDSLRGPGFGNLDMGLFRTFGLREWLKMQFRAEAFNFTNTPHFSNPDAGVTDGNFGLINSTNPGGRLIDERYFRLGLKLLF